MFTERRDSQEWIELIEDRETWKEEKILQDIS